METSRGPATSLAPGLEGSATARVTDALTAPAVGSGTVAVYASPSMIALMEAASVASVAAHLAPGQTTVGIHLDIAHTAATPPGMAVSAKATLVAVEERKLTFEVEARDALETIGTGRHVRVIVDAARFEAKAARKTA